jgi:hypothetical protein
VEGGNTWVIMEKRANPVAGYGGFDQLDSGIGLFIGGRSRESYSFLSSIN